MRPDGTEFIMKSVIKRYILFKRNQSDGNGSKMKLQLKEFVTECKSTNMRMSVSRTVRMKEKKETCRQTNIVGVLPHENILMYF